MIDITYLHKCKPHWRVEPSVFRDTIFFSLITSEILQCDQTRLILDNIRHIRGTCPLMVYMLNYWAGVGNFSQKAYKNDGCKNFFLNYAVNS